MKAATNPQDKGKEWDRRRLRTSCDYPGQISDAIRLRRSVKLSDAVRIKEASWSPTGSSQRG